jgi:hypothetical protein
MAEQRIPLVGFERLPGDDDELWELVATIWGVEIPRLAVCAGHVAPFTAFAEAYWARESMYVWEASRGLGGKSFLLSILGLTIAVTRGGDVNIVGGSGEQAKRVHDYMIEAWQHRWAPRGLLRSDPTVTKTRLAKGNTIQALVASAKSIRGPHVPTLLCDEADEFELPLFDAAMGQTMAKPGLPALTVVSSTHHYANGTMTEIKRRAKEKHWTLFTWCYKESLQPHGWLSPDEIARKKRETTDAMFSTEFDLQEPHPEDRAIQPSAVTQMFSTAMGHYRGAAHEYIEHEAPDVEGRYAHGADWARATDWTEIITLRIDVMPARLVAYERMQRLPWPVMVARLEARVKRYGADRSSTCHDRTGLGDVVEGYVTVEVDGIQMVGRTRSDLFSQVIGAIENNELVSPMIEVLEQQLRFVSINDLYGSGHPPDGFVALALAWHARGGGPVDIW